MTEERVIEVLGIMKSQMKEFGMTARFEGLREMQETAVDVAVKSLSEIQQYRAIGTVEECREARERHREKKPNITTGKTEEDKLACRPICEGNLDWTYNGFWRKGNPKYCSNCGQSIDWSDTP